jgi:predicted amidophosphoribosyltransferase
VAGAFLAVSPPAWRRSVSPAPLSGGAPSARIPPLILVDDVFTTGATVAAAAGALADAGWTEIRAVTFARAAPIELRVL